jgi:pyruvate/2-oxoglutarate dehydrogenase complex dihydrolipoamide dehydrogenase (E3) component
MINDYDLVVIGASPEGIYAAITATQLQARVALVTYNDTGYLDNGSIINHSFNEIGRLNFQKRNDIFGVERDSSNSLFSLTEARNWGNAVHDNLIAENSLTTAATLGVDVIVGKGEFCRLPKLAFNINQRKLRSRHFLLATSSIFRIKNIDDTVAANCLTYNDFLQLPDLSTLPNRLAIVGSSPRSLELAQSLTRFGKNVTLIVSDSRILSSEDIDTSLLIQAHLEAEGIEIITNAKVTQIKEFSDSKWLQAGDRAIETDAIIFVDARQPNIEGLNLAGVEVKYNSHGILVNRKLQTTNPKIYACGDILGGYSLFSLAQYEANIALKNTLFLPLFKIDYRCLPWGIFTQPNMMRVGLTETKAKQHYGDNFYVIKEYFKSVTQGQINGITTGWCKLLVTEQGEILGCTIIGDHAAELISAIALMMQHKIQLSPNLMKGMTTVEIPYISPSFAEIWQKVTNNYYRQKLQHNPKLLSWLETWFNWRR